MHFCNGNGARIAKYHIEILPKNLNFKKIKIKKQQL